MRFKIVTFHDFYNFMKMSLSLQCGALCAEWLSNWRSHLIIYFRTGNNNNDISYERNSHPLCPTRFFFLTDSSWQKISISTNVSFGP